MQRYTVFSGSTLVGHSALEAGDPPMGVATGRFYPAAGYRSIQARCREDLADQSMLGLIVRTPDRQVIQCAGVSILDYSAEFGETAIELNVLGIRSPAYEALFPQHVAEYEKRFR